MGKTKDEWVMQFNYNLELPWSGTGFVPGIGAAWMLSWIPNIYNTNIDIVCWCQYQC